MNLVMRGNLLDRSLPLDRLQGNLRLPLCAELPPLPFHLPPSQRQRILHLRGLSEFWGPLHLTPLKKPPPFLRFPFRRAGLNCVDSAFGRSMTTSILSRARKTHAYIVFVVEAGFMLAPLLRRTWAPRGCTP